MKNKFVSNIIITLFISLFTISCVDHVPKVEELPNPDVAFHYSVIDDEYQLDYYVGATVQFTSTSAVSGNCVWDFGDGNKESGDVVTHKYSTEGTYQVTLTVEGAGLQKKNIYISDIKPIMTLNPIEGGICEVLTSYVSFNIELPNPEKLEEEYTWIFPKGTMDENGNIIEIYKGENPGKIKFSHVGSQTVRLQVKLGGRQLEEGTRNVQVAYNEEVPTLYYAVKSGNIMALKLANNPPAGMDINAFNMGVRSGQHPLNILFNDTSLYVLDCGRQFTYVNDEAGNLGDGRIMVMSKDGSKVETMMTNNGAAFDDPFYGYIEGTYLYFTDRNTGIMRIGLSERNRSFVKSEFPYVVENQRLGYYNSGLAYGSINACFGKIGDVWYWCKTYNGTGIFRFLNSDILPELTGGDAQAPASGIALSSMLPKSFVWNPSNDVIYFTVYDTGYEGFYACPLNELGNISSRGQLAPYKKTLANGKTVTPITEAGKGEGSSGEFIGICQLTLDKEDGSVYFGLRSADADVKSGLMRYNPATDKIEHVIEGVEVYGVAVNGNKSKLF